MRGRHRGLEQPPGGGREHRAHGRDDLLRRRLAVQRDRAHAAGHRRPALRQHDRAAERHVRRRDRAPAGYAIPRNDRRRDERLSTRCGERLLHGRRRSEHDDGAGQRRRLLVHPRDDGHLLLPRAQRTGAREQQRTEPGRLPLGDLYARRARLAADRLVSGGRQPHERLAVRGGDQVRLPDRRHDLLPVRRHGGGADGELLRPGRPVHRRVGAERHDGAGQHRRLRPGGIHHAGHGRRLLRPRDAPARLTHLRARERPGRQQQQLRPPRHEPDRHDRVRRLERRPAVRHGVGHRRGDGRDRRAALPSDQQRLCGGQRAVPALLRHSAAERVGDRRG